MRVSSVKLFFAIFCLVILSNSAFAVPLCYTGEVIWQGGPSPAVGCLFNSWGTQQQAMCQGNTTLTTINDGNCYGCIKNNLVANVQNGNWGGLTIGVTQGGALPADFSCLQCVNAVAGTVGWWPLDELALGSVIDLSSFGNDGTHMNNPVSVSGLVMNGLKFNGTNGFVEVPNSASLNLGTGNFSLHAWVKVNSASGTSVIVDKRSQAPFKGYHLFLYNGKLGMQLADGVGTGYSNYVSTGSAIPVDNNWHHVAVTVERASTTGIKFYLNGALNGSPLNPTGRSGSLTNTAPLRIASRSFGSAGTFNGSIDELTLANQILTPLQVQALFNIRFFGQCK